MRGKCILFTLVLLALASSTSLAQDTTRVVVPGNYTQIDWAIKYASASVETIAVTSSGIYKPFTLDRSIRVTNESSSAVTIDAADTSSCAVGITASGGIVDGFTIKGGTNYGVYMTAGTLQNCSVEQGTGTFTQGIYADGSCTIDHCTVTITATGTNYTGIHQESGSPTITSNVIAVAQGTGIDVGDIGETTTGSITDCSVTVGEPIGIAFESGTLTVRRNDVDMTGTNQSLIGIKCGGPGHTDHAPATVRDCLVTGGSTGTGVLVNDDSVDLKQITVHGFYFGIKDAFYQYTTPTGVPNEFWQCITSGTNPLGYGFVGGKTYFCIVDADENHRYSDVFADSGSVAEDPLFCDAANDEYTLRVDSYGARGNNPTGERIGARNVACMYGTLVRTSNYVSPEPGYVGTISMRDTVIVPAGDTLSLALADVKVDKLTPTTAKLQVNGDLRTTSSVTFESAEASPGNEDWYGIVGGNGTKVFLNSTTVRDATIGLFADDLDSVKVTSCTFENTKSAGLLLQGVASGDYGLVESCTFDIDEGTAIELQSGVSGLTVKDNTITGGSSCSYGIAGYATGYSGSPLIQGNAISGFSNGSGVYLAAGSSTIRNNTIQSCKYGIWLTGGTHLVGTTNSSSDNTLTGNTNGLRCEGSSTGPTVRNNQIQSNTMGVVARSSAYPDLGNLLQNGNNSIYNNNTYCVNNTTTGLTVTANGNWWGSNQMPTCTNGSVSVSGWLSTAPAAFGVGIEEVTARRAQGIRLLAAQPNPTEGASRIAFELDGGGGAVRIGIYDLAGRLVRSFDEGTLSEGRHEVRWDGRDAGGRRVGNGIYFIKVAVSHGPQGTGKVLVVR